MTRFAWQCGGGAGMALARPRGGRRASASVEFAITSMALFSFLLAILNLGDAGLVLGVLQHGAEAGARAAAIQASVANAGATPAPASFVCTSASQIQADFNNFATPGVPPASGSTTDGTPVITAIWVNGNNTTPPNNYPNGVSLSMTVTYKWKPIGFAALGLGMNFGVSTVASVLGSAAVTSMAATGC